MEENKMEVRTTDRELFMSRVFDAPRQRVFEAFSSCEQLSHWWGPREWPMRECTLDFRPGGEWHFCLRGPNPGDESWGKAIYEEIVALERIVYRDYFSDEEGNINPDMPTVLATFEFVDEDGKTRLNSRSHYEDPSDLEKVLDMGMVEGMASSLDRLEEHLAKVEKAG